MFENTVLRDIFGVKREEVTRNWRKLHNDELHDLYSPTNTIRIIKENAMARHIAYTAKRRNAQDVLVTIPERKRQLERPRHKWGYSNLVTNVNMITTKSMVM
jgi:hypothetical protein